MLFDVLGNILTGKSEKLYQTHIAAEDFSAASKFMLLKYLTMSTNPIVRELVVDNYLRLEKMPEKALYKYLLRKIPKQSNSFIRYIR